jgi:hypothetical protein
VDSSPLGVFLAGGGRRLYIPHGRSICAPGGYLYPSAQERIVIRGSGPLVDVHLFSELGLIGD